MSCIQANSLAEIDVSTLAGDDRILLCGESSSPLIEFAKANATHSATVVQTADPVPAALRESLRDLPSLLLSPFASSDVVVLTVANQKTAEELSRHRRGQFKRTQTAELAVQLAGTGTLHHIHVEENPGTAERFPELGPGHAIVSAELLLEALSGAAEVRRLHGMNRQCVEAGILLLWDQLDACHEISQTMEGKGTPRTGDYWHEIMHRREPDPGNAAYWVRRVGQHPAYGILSSHLQEWLVEQKTPLEEMKCLRDAGLIGRPWDPHRMIDLTQAALREPGAPVESALRRVQYLEILNLLAFRS
ncbi:MAG: hypothetical protein JNL58_08925 [Planctomyces sp.]|nr:hypothetical protein [Planctomyces sp.]